MDNLHPISTEEPKISSLIERASDLFSAPGKLYSEVATAPVQRSSWVFPYITSMVVTLLITIAMFSNQSLRDQVMAPQKEQIQQRVEKGEMTQEQADTASEFMDGSVMPLIFGAVGSVVVVTMNMFGVGLVLWLVVKFILKTTVGYKKILEVYGLATLIAIVNSVLTIMMMHLFDSVRATPGASLFFIGNFDSQNFFHSFLVSMNILTIWQTAVVGIGIAKISNKPTSTGMALSFGLWLLWVILSSLVGWGMR